MPQTLKPEIRRKILESALGVFSEKGYQGSAMSEIAKKAGISTGNIYRYFPDKDTLFYEALPQKLSEWLKESIRKKMELPVANSDSSTFRQGQEELVQLLLDYRREWSILFRNAHGTSYENLTADMTDYLVGLFERYLASNGQDRKLGHPGFKSALREIYRNTILGLSGLLSSDMENDALRQAILIFMQYHLAGILTLCPQD